MYLRNMSSKIGFLISVCLSKTGHHWNSWKTPVGVSHSASDTLKCQSTSLDAQTSFSYWHCNKHGDCSLSGPLRGNLSEHPHPIVSLRPHAGLIQLCIFRDYISELREQIPMCHCFFMLHPQQKQRRNKISMVKICMSINIHMQMQKLQQIIQHLKHFKHLWENASHYLLFCNRNPVVHLHAYYKCVGPEPLCVLASQCV